MLDGTPIGLISTKLTKELCREEDREPGSRSLNQ